MPDWPEFPRVDLAGGPTPLEFAPRLTHAIGGPRIWIKRDDLTPLALGGNKLRKLEYLIADALRERAEVVVTAGAAQSNHAVQTAAACNIHGLRCVAVLAGPPDAPITGNLLLNHLLGAEIRLRAMDLAERNQAAEEVARDLRAEGEKVYVVPVGGSNALGVIGYARAAFEIAQQARGAGFTPSAVVCASGSGGTQAGLALGSRGLGDLFEVLGISVRTAAGPQAEAVARLASAGAELVSEAPFTPDQIHVADGYIGAGYGALTPESRAAILLGARTEGVLTDPVYTGKALSGLIGEAKRGRWTRDQDVVFVHTGGAPALFAYNEALLET
jgi:D-cysteine desulfhydrase family pyridoxal phosphate-dependent enzyme